jgi:hypothetical protein
LQTIDMLHLFLKSIFLAYFVFEFVSVLILWSVFYSQSHLPLCIELTHHESPQQLFTDRILLGDYCVIKALCVVLEVHWAQKYQLMSKAGALFRFYKCILFPVATPKICLVIQVASLLHANKCGERNGCTLHIHVSLLKLVEKTCCYLSELNSLLATFSVLNAYL